MSYIIRKFEDKYRFLSNFYTSPIVYEGIKYYNAEAAFQSAKTLNIGNRLKFSKLGPSDAKKLGRRIELRDDWEEVKEKIMYEIVKDKFNRNPNLAEKLLNTLPKYLIEGNTWHDNIWGDCECDKCKNIKGQNKLGEILMRVRSEKDDTWNI